MHVHVHYKVKLVYVYQLYNVKTLIINWHDQLLILVLCNFSVMNITIDEVDQALVSEVVEVRKCSKHNTYNRIYVKPCDY